MTATAASGLRPPRALRPEDHARACLVVEEWFGHPVGLVMHRLFFDQLGPSGVWLEEGDGRPAGFLLGLISEAEPDLAYVHMHAVAPARRGQGVGELLYRTFASRASNRGCSRIRALAAPSREASRRFHDRLGFVARWEPDYLGPGGDRHVYERELPLEQGADGPATGAPASQRPTDKDDRMNNGHKAGAERRQFPRAEVVLPVRVSDGDAVVRAETINISEGGLLIAGSDFPSAAQVRVEIELAELGWHALDAEVVRRVEGSDGDSLAIRFAEAATHGGRDAIRRFFRSRISS